MSVTETRKIDDHFTRLRTPSHSQFAKPRFVTFPDDLMPLMRQRKMMTHARRRHSARCHLMSPVPSSIPSDTSSTTRLPTMVIVFLVNASPCYRIQLKSGKLPLSNPFLNYNSAACQTKVDIKIIYHLKSLPG